MTSGKIIGMLMDRSGFDDWWFNIDEETQQEIKNDIDKIVIIDKFGMMKQAH